MKSGLLVFAIFLAACRHITSGEALDIAYARLSTCEDGPSLHGSDLRSALTVSQRTGGKFLVEARDDRRNLLWAVIVFPSGESEISRMAVDG